MFNCLSDFDFAFTVLCLKDFDVYMIDSVSLTVLTINAYCVVDRDEASTQSLNRSLAGSSRTSESDTLDLARRRRGSNDVVDASAN